MRSRRPIDWIRSRGRLLVTVASAGLAFVSPTTDAQAFEVKSTAQGALVHWDDARVTFTVDPSLDANVARGSDAAKQAMSAWSGSVGAPELATALETASKPSAPGLDRKNGIFFMADGYAPAGRALAITVLTYDVGTGAIVDADVVFNGRYRFAVLGSTQGESAGVSGAVHVTATDGITHKDEPAKPDATYDLHHVIAHELGHSLGMNDEFLRRDALMYRYSPPNDASMRTPTADDIEGLAEIYSAKLEARGNGCGGAMVTPQKPSLAASRTAMFATLALLAFLLLRARSQRGARLGFVVALAAAIPLLLPEVSRHSGSASAKSLGLEPGHARAKVVETHTTVERGLFRTTVKLETLACRVAACPKASHGSVWGGTIGSLRQEIGDQFAPDPGSEVDVSFAKLPSALGPIENPLGRGARDGDALGEGVVRTLTLGSSPLASR